MDGPLRTVAATVLNTFGQDVTFRAVTGTAYNLATRTMMPTTSDTVLKGRLDGFMDWELSDSVLASDRKLTIAAVDCPTVPKPADLFVIAGLEYQVVKPLETVVATDQPAIYVLQLRR